MGSAIVKHPLPLLPVERDGVPIVTATAAQLLAKIILARIVESAPLKTVERSDERNV